jgi:uncharacterized repeat protein (TIGR01451 family)
VVVESRALVRPRIATSNGRLPNQGEPAVRKRRILLTAAVTAAGLAALGSVVAQQPSGYPNYPAAPVGTLPPAGTPLPPPPVRQWNDWSPGQPPPGYTPKQTNAKPAGGYLPTPPGYTPNPVQPASVNAPRLTRPAIAGPNGVSQAGGQTLPPPKMDGGAFRASPVGVAAPALPPLPPSPGLPAVPNIPAVPTTPVPLPPSVSGKAEPSLPAAPPLPAVSTPPSPFPVVPSVPQSTVLPPNVPATPSTAPATRTLPTGLMPGRTTPSVTIEAVCPETVVFGQELAYKLIVRNTGTSAVAGVRVDDELPSGSRYVGSEPVAESNGDHLTWQLGALEAGAEKQITVRVKPSEEGETHSRATVTLTSTVDARTRVTRPRLVVAVVGSEVCRAGEETSFQIKVTNSGTGPATHSVVRAQLSDGLLHSQGVVIEAPIENVPAGETKIVKLNVSAAKAGLQWCQITVTAAGSPDATAKASTNVVEPMLTVKQSGPAKCLVRAEPTFTIELSNPGTAATDPVVLQSVLPDGFEWINQASDSGTCSGRTVTWRLPALAAGSNRTLTLKLRASAATDARGSLLRTVAHAGPAGVVPAGGATPVRNSRSLEAKAETAVVAEGVAAVRFDVVGLDNPVAVGKEVTYEIRVMNQGTGACSNVQIAAALAEGTEFVGATTGNNQNGTAKVVGQQLSFDLLPTLGVKGEVVYRVRVKGNAAGDLRFRVQLSCDQLKTPVVKEESTTFVKE